MAAKLGISNGGSAFGMDAMSPTVSTSTAQDDDAGGHHHQRDQRREGLQRLDEVKHRPHRDGGDGDQTRRKLPRPDMRERVDELADGVVAVGSVAGGVMDAPRR